MASIYGIGSDGNAIERLAFGSRDYFWDVFGVTEQKDCAAWRKHLLATYYLYFAQAELLRFE